LLREVYINLFCCNLFCWFQSLFIFENMSITTWVSTLKIEDGKMRCWPSQCWPRPLWLVLITFCQIDQCHSIHSGGWFTKWYESNIEYTIPKLNFQVDFQDESPSILAALGFLTKDSAECLRPVRIFLGKHWSGCYRTHLSLFGGLGDRGDRSEKMSTGRLVRSGHIWSYIHIYIYVVIYIYTYIYMCVHVPTCSNPGE
jgi:hypothetical protein